MNEKLAVRIRSHQIQTTARPARSFAVVGAPNSGKSTLFNRLTGLRQKTANYPGVTVEEKLGRMAVGTTTYRLMDLPGIYSLAANSQDEAVSVAHLLNRLEGATKPDCLLVVIDSSRLPQGLFLLNQLLELELPLLVALTMNDVALTKGVEVDTEKLEQLLNLPVVAVSATSGRGIERLKTAMNGVDKSAPPGLAWPQLSQKAADLAQALGITRAEAFLALCQPEGDLAAKIIEPLDGPARKRLQSEAQVLFGDNPPLAEEARKGHRWARDVAAEVTRRLPPTHQASRRIARWLSQPFPATVLFLGVMMVVFQAVFAWATPLMDGIDIATVTIASAVAEHLPDGALSSFITDGVIAGVGSVIIFLPQILILFAFIIVLEDSGFLARSAFLMDRFMRYLGLSGQSVIPLVSSFACAVPAVMATRVIPSYRERLATILCAPFITCSARLPVYALLIGAFVPQQDVGIFNLQGLVLFGLYMLGIVGGVVTAIIANHFLLRGNRSAFAMSLPDLRWPTWRNVLVSLMDRARIFLRRAGTVIFAVAVLVWALAYFPRLEPQVTSAAVSQEQLGAEQLEQSYLGRAGKFVEPVFRPLGWDWKVSAAVIAGFPAREVVVAVLGTIYAVGDDAEEARLAERLKQATWPDGRPVFTLPMVFGLLVFYAWCLQCAATVAVIRRETNSWGWALGSWAYMTALGYLGALAIFQLGS